jgi:hypothetical protein
MSTIADKLNLIAQTITEIGDEDPGTAAILLEGFAVSIGLMQELQETGTVDAMDVSRQLEVITNVLGVSLEDLVNVALSNIQSKSDKPADQETLDFITSDLDDYERFLAQSKAKEDLDFLSKEI